MAYKQNSPQAVIEGGTGAQTLTDHGVLVGSGTGAVTPVGPVASTGALLASNGVGSDPGFTTATYPLTSTANEILYSSATNTITGLTSGNNGVLITSATGVPSILAAGTTGQVLTATTGSPPSWAAPAGGGVTGPGSSTDRAIATWNGTGGSALFDNSSITISSAGEMTNASQPAFLAYLGTNVTNATGAGTAWQLGTTTALTEVFDQNSDFNTNGTFTAPVTGKYRLSGYFNVGNFTAANTMNIYITTSNGIYYFASINANNVKTGGGTIVIVLGGTVLADMDASDTATLNLACSGEAGDTNTVVATLRITHFCGELVC